MSKRNEYIAQNGIRVTSKNVDPEKSVAGNTLSLPVKTISEVVDEVVQKFTYIKEGFLGNPKGTIVKDTMFGYVSHPKASAHYTGYFATSVNGKGVIVNGVTLTEKCIIYVRNLNDVEIFNKKPTPAPVPVEIIKVDEVVVTPVEIVEAKTPELDVYPYKVLPSWKNFRVSQEDIDSYLSDKMSGTVLAKKYDVPNQQIYKFMAMNGLKKAEYTIAKLTNQDVTAAEMFSKTLKEWYDSVFENELTSIDGLHKFIADNGDVLYRLINHLKDIETESVESNLSQPNLLMMIMERFFQNSIKTVEKIVEKKVEVLVEVEKIVEKEVEVLVEVEKIIERVIEKPVEKVPNGNTNYVNIGGTDLYVKLNKDIGKHGDVVIAHPIGDSLVVCDAKEKIREGFIGKFDHTMLFEVAGKLYLIDGIESFGWQAPVFTHKHEKIRIVNPVIQMGKVLARIKNHITEDTALKLAGA